MSTNGHADDNSERAALLAVRREQDLTDRERTDDTDPLEGLRSIMRSEDEPLDRFRGNSGTERITQQQ
jgi:hypothetical protein